MDSGRETGKLGQLIRDSDIPGILAFVTSLMLAMMALLNVMPGYRWYLLGAATVIGALFAWRELRFQPPFLDLRLLGRNRPLLLVYLLFVVFSGVYYFAFFGLPQLLQEAGNYDAGVVGLLMLPLAALSVVVTPLTVRFIERFGVRSVLITGGVDPDDRDRRTRVPDHDPVGAVGVRPDCLDGRAVWGGQHGVEPGPLRFRPPPGERGSGLRDLPDLPLPRGPSPRQY